MTAGELGKVTDYLAAEFDRLHHAGADFAALTANTPHIIFDELQQRSSLPLISIVEATRDHVQKLGLKTVALFGTRFTMQAPFYPGYLLLCASVSLWFIILQEKLTTETQRHREKRIGSRS